MSADELMARAEMNDALEAVTTLFCGMALFALVVIVLSPLLNWLLGNDQWFYWG